MRKPRIKALDVAKAAEVSTATVSLVINGKADKRVPLETRQRVLKVASELGYTVDRRARGLATGTSRLIGFIVPNSVGNPFFSAVHMELMRELGSSYQVLIVATDVGEDIARQNIEQLLAIGIDALVGISVDSAYLKPIEANIPMILVDSDRSGPGIAALNFAVEDGARELARHLVDFGHRKFAYIDAKTQSRTFPARRNAFMAALAEMGVESPVILETEIEMTDAETTVATILQKWKSDGITAIVCATDLQAYGVLTALKALAIQVPDDMSLAGFDDLPFSRAMDPQLTSVRLPGDALARGAVAELRGLLKQKSPRIASIVINVELHPRASTGKAKTLA
ncbi:LacI family DNA-binding transcriptional regulator [Agrobacterium larrymoorei]|nr:LacI family DNA-binding transcriptional regulator [Agrobacterium larrymoorei]QYA10097.1 LacI family DNA-binding transcriptional regulator [Agrobacterium larrymoorei]